MAVRVDCTAKESTAQPHGRISAIGGKKPDGSCWKRSQAAAIAEIESGAQTFYVNLNGAVPNVVVAVADGVKYLKTQFDQHAPTTLLALPDC